MTRADERAACTRVATADPGHVTHGLEPISPPAVAARVTPARSGATLPVAATAAACTPAHHTEQFRPPVLGDPGAVRARRGDEPDGHGLVRLPPRPHGHRVVGRSSGRSSSGGADGPSWKVPVAAVEARRPGMMLLIAMAITVRLRSVPRDVARRLRPRLLVGAVAPGHDHAPRPLAGDEGPRPGSGRPRRPRRAAPRLGRAGHRRRVRRDRHPRRPGGRRRGARPRRGPGAADGTVVDGAPSWRVDDHGRIQAGRQGRRRPGGRRDGVDGLGDPGPGRRSRRRHHPGRHPTAGDPRPRTSRSRAQALADRAAALLFYVATAAAAVTAVRVAGDRQRRRRWWSGRSPCW